MNPAGGKQLRAHQPDYVLLLLVFILLMVGLVVMYSISPVLSHKMFGSVDRNYYFFRQLGNIAVGVGFWILASNLHYDFWRRWSGLLLVGAAVSTLLLFVPGLAVTELGATRWVDLKFTKFQPSEVMKLAFIVYLASWFAKNADNIRSFGQSVLPFSVMLAAVSFVIVVLQRDMGTMLVLAGAAVGMLYVAGTRLTHMAAVLGAGLAAGWLSIVTFPHRMARWTVFLDPSQDPDGRGYHISQALIAIGSGGLFGLGLGRSIQVYGYLPEAANDSIFAIMAEMFGLFGSTAILGLFIAIIYRALRIARQAPDIFSRLLATGVALWFLLQSIINIAAMLSLVPLTGIPLPFISYGGTSMVFTLIGVGILINISKYTLSEVANAGSSQRRRNGWSHFSDSGHGRRVKVAR